MRKNTTGFVFAILLIAAVTFSGCVEEYSGYVEEETFDVELIPISGIAQNITVSSDKPVRLVVSCIGDVITVFHGVKLIDIVMSQSDNTVYIHQSANPQVRISGIRCEIIRYESANGTSDSVPNVK